jgi:hypothetical protein
MINLPLGNICATPGALDAVGMHRLTELLLRHARGDWGDLCEEDKKENNFAVGKELRVLSAYRIVESDPESEKVWIITEADRSATTFLLPSEY